MAKEGIPTAPDVGKILIAFAFIAGIALGTAFAYYFILPYSTQSVQSQSASLSDQVDLLSQQVDDLTLQLDRAQHPEKFRACDQNVAFSGDCKKLCTGVQFNPVSKSCELKSAKCCSVQAPFDSLQSCNTVCVGLTAEPPILPSPFSLQSNGVVSKTDKPSYARGEKVFLAVFNSLDARADFVWESILIERLDGNQWTRFASIVEFPCGPVAIPAVLPVPLRVEPRSLQLISWNAQHIDCTDFESQGIQKTIQATRGSYRFKLFGIGGAVRDEFVTSNEFTVQ